MPQSRPSARHAAGRRRRSPRQAQVLVAVGVAVIVAVAFAVTRDDDKDTDSTDTVPARSVPAEAREYCAAMASIGDVNGGGGEQADLPAKLTTVRTGLDKAVEKAPPAVVDDVRGFASAYGQFVDAMAAAGYDVNRLSPEQVQILSAPATQSALQRMTDYGTRTCG